MKSSNMGHKIFHWVLASAFIQLSQSIDNLVPLPPSLANFKVTVPPSLANFSDPALFKDPISNDWFAFSTSNGGQNIPVARSADFVRWERMSIDALPTSSLPDWVQSGNSTIWAPDVFYVWQLANLAIEANFDRTQHTT